MEKLPLQMIVTSDPLTKSPGPITCALLMLAIAEHLRSTQDRSTNNRP